MPTLAIIKPPTGKLADEIRPHIVHVWRGKWVVPYEVWNGRCRRIYGLGDLVHAICRILRIDRLAKLYERRTGRPCGCNRRRQKLNKLWSFNGTTTKRKAARKDV